MEPENSSNKTSNISSKHKKFILLPVVVIVVLAVIIFLVFMQPTVKDERIFVSNISQDKVTVSWLTKSPAREWISVVEKGTLSSKIIKDDKETFFLPLGSFNLHYVTVPNLSPNKTYTYKIYQNFKETAGGTFTTPANSGVDVSKIVTGQVLAADEKTPAKGVIVYLQLTEGIQQSTLLSSVTDNQGKWNANILGAKSADLKNDFKIGSRSAALVVVEAGESGRFNSRFAVDDKTKELPSLILKGTK